MKTICVIPAYNCSKQVVRVLEKLKDSNWQSFHSIWVIDNGSSDGTSQAAKEQIEKLEMTNAKVFQNSRNINLGGTHKVAFREARQQGATHVLILHGDDQAEAKESEKLLVLSASLGESTVLGSRFMKGSKLKGYNFGRVLGNRVLNLIYSIATSKWLTDLGSGLNLFALKDITDEEIASFGNSLSFNYELILLIVRNKRDFVYVPISWSEEDQVSNARNFNIFFKALSILGEWLARRERDEMENSTKDVYLKVV